VELSKLIETAAFERAWQNDPPRIQKLQWHSRLLAEGLQLLSILFSPRLRDLTISIEHSVVPFTGSTNIATSDGYSRREKATVRRRSNYLKLLPREYSGPVTSSRWANVRTGRVSTKSGPARHHQIKAGATTRRYGV
jgi:hypothetical protein